MARRRGKALCTIATGRFQELLDIAGPTFERYAARHGYVLDVRTELLAPERPPSWSKVVLLRELVAKHRFAMWVDCDAIIVDSTRDLADERRRGKHAYIVEHHYQGQRIPNFGVVGMRGSAWSERFLDQVWSMTEYLDHKWWENAAVLDLSATARWSRCRRRPRRRRRSWGSTTSTAAGTASGSTSRPTRPSCTSPAPATSTASSP
jgi:hypothetical protein